MKSFQQFLSEAPRTSRAVEQARRLGFVSDGHGNWYDREGNYKGHTEKGELILAQKRGGGKEDAPAKQKAAQAQPAQQSKQPQAQGGATGMPASEDGGEGGR